MAEQPSQDPTNKKVTSQEPPKERKPRTFPPAPEPVAKTLSPGLRKRTQQGLHDILGLLILVDDHSASEGRVLEQFLQQQVDDNVVAANGILPHRHVMMRSILPANDSKHSIFTGLSQVAWVSGSIEVVFVPYERLHEVPLCFEGGFHCPYLAKTAKEREILKAYLFLKM